MTADMDANLDSQLEIIRGLRGVIYAFYLDKDILEELR